MACRQGRRRAAKKDAGTDRQERERVRRACPQRPRRRQIRPADVDAKAATQGRIVVARRRACHGQVERGRAPTNLFLSTPLKRPYFQYFPKSTRARFWGRLGTALTR